MKLEQALLVLVLLMAAGVGLLLLIPEPEAATGSVHSTFSTMQQGGSPERHRPVLLVGWLLGSLSIVIFVVLAAIGARQKGSLRGLGKPLLYYLAGYLVVWAAVFLAYRTFFGEQEPALFLALPWPTALVLYVLWPAPMVLPLLYAAGYKRWVFSPRDRERYEALLAERDQRASASQDR